VGVTQLGVRLRETIHYHIGVGKRVPQRVHTTTKVKD
jgi:hypothetical protein